MGHSSLRILTAEDKVIYIDPYVGDYSIPADLILRSILFRVPNGGVDFRIAHLIVGGDGDALLLAGIHVLG